MKPNRSYRRFLGPSVVRTIVALSVFGSMAVFSTDAAGANIPTAGTTSIPSIFRLYGQVSEVGSTSVTAVKEQSQDSIQFKVPSKQTKYLKEGQPVWVNAATNQAMVVDFPIYGKSGKERVKKGKSWWMKTNITISNTGRIDGETRTWSKEAMRGFTGGVMVFLYDADGNVLHSTKLRKYGVNGEAMGPPSDRKDLWNEPIDPAVVVKTKKYAIVHKHSPTDRQDEFLEKAEKAVEIAATIVSIITSAQGGGGGGETGGTGGETPTGTVPTAD